MFSVLFSASKLLRVRYHPVCICISWVIGLISGYMVSNGVSSSLPYMMQSACSCSVSFGGFLAVLLLPFLIACLCYRLSIPVLIIPLLYLKGFSYAICSVSIFQVFHSASWLVQSLLLFSDHISIFLLMVFSVRHCSQSDLSALKRDGLIVFSVLLGVGVIDYLYISPLMMRLM